MRTYELMVIHRPEMSETDVQSAVAEVETAITAGGEVDAREMWGKRRLAYEIDHIHEGHYSVVTFKGETELVQRLDMALGLQDTVIRHKIVRVA